MQLRGGGARPVPEVEPYLVARLGARQVSAPRGLHLLQRRLVQRR